MGHRQLLTLSLLVCSACGAGGGNGVDGSVPDDSTPVDGSLPDASLDDGAGFAMWRDAVQPAIAAECGPCHLGTRFNMASLERAGDSFTVEETRRNYQVFLDMISLDHPTHSRLLAKGLGAEETEGIHHGVESPSFTRTDAIYATLRTWIETEKAARCPGCGTTAEKAYIAYVQQPEVHWMIEHEPTREDRGTHHGAKIMIQEVRPDTLERVGDPVDFLGDDFCPAGDTCNYGQIAASHDGAKVAFECRMPVHGEPWLEQTWNLCLADVGEDGRAVNPRFLKPEAERFSGLTVARTSPFGLRNGGTDDAPYISPYNKHFMLRRRTDQHPAFSPDDQRLYYSSQAPDPRTGDDMVETYHGSFHLKHLVSSRLDGSDTRTIMRNDGGTVDFPFFRRNGNVAAHVWNLERMDRHMYGQATADGMMELPVLLGRRQGPNNWGKAFEMVNGLIVGMTGRRRGELDNYAPFVADHTVGVQGLDPGLEGFQGFEIIDTAYHEEIGAYPNGFCPTNIDAETAESTPNCTISQLVLDASWTPHDRALVAYNPEKTYIGIGEQFFDTYASGGSVEERQESARRYLPKHLGVGLYDLDGGVQTLIENAPGTFVRYPVWIGRRQPPRIQPEVTDERARTAEVHIADVPIWLTFGMSTNDRGDKRGRYEMANASVSLRILRKVSDGNACVQDNRYIRMSNRSSNGLHPTALGLIDATGWEQFMVPMSAGGDAYGDVPLAEDGSVRVRVPAGELLWFVGIDAEGHVSAHRQRVSAFPPGHQIETGVKAEHYDAQCARCHGSIATPLSETRDLRELAAVMDFDTVAATSDIVDLTAAGVSTRLLTYRDVLRPLLQTQCASCHSGESAAGELSFDTAYSATGNFPKGSWVDSTWDEYVAFMNAQDVTLVPSYNFSTTYSFFFRDDHDHYKEFYADQMATHEPLAALAPWDPAYQNLLTKIHYVNGTSHVTAIGRVPQEGGNSRHSFLLEVLTGRDLDGTHDYVGMDHTAMLSAEELRTIAAVLDAGMPFTARCSDRTIPTGPNAGEPWGTPTTAPARSAP